MFDSSKTLMSLHDMDAPVKASFASHWSQFARRRGTAMMLPESIGPFAMWGGASKSDQEDFVHLVRNRSTPAALLQADAINLPCDLSIVAQHRGVQMTPVHATSKGKNLSLLPLGRADREDMLELANLSKPGPFERDTHRLGVFIGLREEGQLIAMAGQRMAFPGWIEISAVCVHPEWQGAGIGRGLFVAMVDRILAQGQQPFLHTYADNEGAIRLYRKLGFDIRCEVNFAIFQ